MTEVHICLSCTRVAKVEGQEKVKVGGVGHRGNIRGGGGEGF